MKLIKYNKNLQQKFDINTVKFFLEKNKLIKEKQIF